MKSILSILNSLAATTKRTEKEAILKREDRLDNEELRLAFWAAYNPDITYWIAQHPEVGSHSNPGIGVAVGISRLMGGLANRRCTGNAAIDYYRMTLEMCNAEDAEVIRRVVDRDLRCGVGVATINKIWPNLIPEYDFMLAESDPKKLVFPCYVQTKVDGLRCLITHKDDGDIVMRTRNGNTINSLEVMYDSLKMVIPSGSTWDGELVCVDSNGNLLDRKTGNGILNKALRGTIKPEEASKVIFTVWDIVDQTKTIPYKARFAQLSALLVLANNKVVMVKNWRADNLQQVEKLFETAILDGEEGVIAKNINAVWQPKKTFDLVKFKVEKSADLVVVDWEEGTGKNVGKLGALVCESRDGNVRVNVGTGFKDEERDWMTPDVMVDKIIEVVYNGRITKKDGGVDSLYLPRFKGIRFDKSEANSSEEIK